MGMLWRILTSHYITISSAGVHRYLGMDIRCGLHCQSWDDGDSQPNSVHWASWGLKTPLYIRETSGVCGQASCMNQAENRQGPHAVRNPTKCHYDSTDPGCPAASQHCLIWAALNWNDNNSQYPIFICMHDTPSCQTSISSALIF